MVQAIIAGTKSQTRRTVKPQPSDCKSTGCCDHWIWRDHHTQLDPLLRLVEQRSPYGRPGDRLWVRETFLIKNAGRCVVHRASMDDVEAAGLGALYGGWKPSIFMPRWASRITLEVTAVRVERLQDISDVDAMSEGLSRGWFNDQGETPGRNLYWAEGVTAKGAGHPTAKDAYRELWDSINEKKHPWSSNPWVWVIAFDLI